MHEYFFFKYIVYIGHSYILRGENTSNNSLYIYFIAFRCIIAEGVYTHKQLLYFVH